MTTNIALEEGDLRATSKRSIVTKVVATLAAVALVAGSYTQAVQAVATARDATKTALSAESTARKAEPVTEATYGELAKSVDDLTQQLKDTQSELALLAQYVQEHSATPSAGVPPHAVPPAAAARPPGFPHPVAEAPAPAGPAATPSAIVARTRAVQARPISKPMSFQVLRDNLHLQ